MGWIALRRLAEGYADAHNVHAALKPSTPTHQRSGAKEIAEYLTKYYGQP